MDSVKKTDSFARLFCGEIVSLICAVQRTLSVSDIIVGRLINADCFVGRVYIPTMNALM